MRKAIIIGGQSAGLTVAYKLLRTTDIHPVILEKTGEVGNSYDEISYFTKIAQRIYTIILLIRSWLYEWKILKPFLSKNKVSPISRKEMAKQIEAMGGEIFINQQIYKIYAVRNEICSLHVINNATGELTLFTGDYFFSSIPPKEILQATPQNSRRFSNLFLLRNKNAYKTIIHA